LDLIFSTFLSTLCKIAPIIYKHVNQNKHILLLNCSLSFPFFFFPFFLCAAGWQDSWLAGWLDGTGSSSQRRGGVAGSRQMFNWTALVGWLDGWSWLVSKLLVSKLLVVWQHGSGWQTVVSVGVLAVDTVDGSSDGQVKTVWLVVFGRPPFLLLFYYYYYLSIY
jgi:hypothetical protein